MSLRLFLMTVMWGLLAMAGFCPAAPVLPTTGQPAPALVVPELDGTVFDLSAQKGEVAIINLWASWCPPCRTEMPVLDAFYRAHRDAGLVMLGLSVDSPYDEDDVHNIAATVHYPVALSFEALTNDFVMPPSLPVTYIVNADGIVSKIFSNGAVTKNALTAAVYH
jgi:cytochrome c biogenesis protein CcmG, thiol:disulfide interchange protein DsbE